MSKFFYTIDNVTTILLKYIFSFVILFLNVLDLYALCVVSSLVISHELLLQHFGENYMNASPLKRKLP